MILENVLENQDFLSLPTYDIPMIQSRFLCVFLVWVTTQWLELLLLLLLLSKKLVNNLLKSLDFSRLFLFSLLSLSINNNLKNKGL
nr:MAG TPA: hypothetical protein [Caudoviricetes sp.]